MLKNSDLIIPNWPAPANVRAVVSTRNGGVSRGIFTSLNLGNHVGDAPENVAENRRRFGAHLPQEPHWLRQVHGTHVARLDDLVDTDQAADAACTSRPKMPCAVMTADCLPVLFCDKNGTTVAAAHAGWRGLAAGVLQTTLAAMRVAPTEIIAYLGPAIGPDAFEVGPEVLHAFVASNAASGKAFHDIGDGKYLADLYQLARLFLADAGVMDVYGGGFCTVIERDRFFSYRRDGSSGRMASAVWIEETKPTMGG